MRINVATGGVQAIFVAGGSLISNQHVLCAGSTLQPANRIIDVNMGGNTRASQRIFAISRRVQHPQYVHTPRNNDIGILFLTQSARFDSWIRPIPLPVEDKVTFVTENIQGLILGFGGNAVNNQQAGSGRD